MTSRIYGDKPSGIKVLCRDVSKIVSIPKTLC